jgi:hypothetical protein
LFSRLGPDAKSTTASDARLSSPVRDPRERRFGRAKLSVFVCLLLILIVGVLETLAWIGMFLLPPHRAARRTTDIYKEQSAMIQALLDPSRPRHIEFHPVLGWRYAPHFRDNLSQMNSKALRSNREYTARPPDNVLRIAAFGDSFVYGSEVDNASAWPAVMESQHPDLEVLNYGVGGYGVDQAYLRYLLEGKDLSPKVVLIGYSPDDINRTVNVYRRFLTDLDSALIKPRYVLDADGSLSLLEMPARLEDYQRMLEEPSRAKRFGQHDYWYTKCMYENPLYDWVATLRLSCTLAAWTYRRHLDPDRPIDGQFYNVNSRAFKIQAALFRRFSDAVRKSGASPLVLVLPDEKSIQRVRQGQPAIYEPLLAHMRAHSIDYVDAAAAFLAIEPASPRGTKDWFAPQGHYSRKGNQIVAAWLATTIRRFVGMPRRGADGQTHYASQTRQEATSEVNTRPVAGQELHLNQRSLALVGLNSATTSSVEASQDQQGSRSLHSSPLSLRERVTYSPSTMVKP